MNLIISVYIMNFLKRTKYKYKGGSFDNTFLRCFPKNLTKIEAAIFQFSGKHYIIPEVAEQFINDQISDVRKQAARDLIENTIYITLQEVSDIVEQLIIKIYTEENLNSYEFIYFYSGQPEKSFYFMSVLALKYIKKHGFKEPRFISSLTNEIFDKIGTDPLVILDDVSYSGSQLATMLNKIYASRVIKDKKETPNIFIMLIALNDFSKKKLSKVSKGRYSSIASPFKLLFLPERLYTPLILALGIERYFYLNILFSPYTSNTPFMSLYLDHKIADEASTYKIALLYGPIVPSNYDYQTPLEECDYTRYILPSGEEGRALLASLNNSNGTNLKDTSDINIYLCKKMMSMDTFQSVANHISFRPFIDECSQNPSLLENIHDTEITNFDYSLFIAPSGCIEGKDCVSSDDYTKFLFDEFFFKTPEEREEAVKISRRIHGYICPTSWYKKGILKMSNDCTTSKSGTKSKSKSGTKFKSI